MASKANIADVLTANALSDRGASLIAFDRLPPEEPPQWWQAHWFWALLAFVAVVPFLVSPLPPLGDLYSHIGRYHVMLDQGRSPFLHKYYAFEWQLVPNMGQDLLVFVVGQWLGAERAAFLLCALMPPATVLLIRHLSIACHGAVQPTAILALPFAYSFTFLSGFMNFHTGLIAAFSTVLLWLKLKKSYSPARFATLAALAPIVWVFHIAAWAILVVIVMALEAAGLFERYRFNLAAFIRHGWPTAVAVVWPIGLSLLMARSAPVFTAAWPLGDIVYLKAIFLLFPLRNENAAFDVFSVYILFATPVVLLLKKRLRIAVGFGFAAAVLFLLYLLTPTDLMNGFYADLRLLPVIWIFALVAMRPLLSARHTTFMVLAGLALFSARMSMTSYGWLARGTALDKDLGALAHLPRGARVAQASPDLVCIAWENTALTHFASFAIFRRDAFVNTEWIIPGAQIMKPIYLPGSPYNVPPRMTYEDCQGVPIGQWLEDLPRDRFDFVWLFKFQPTPASRKWLKPVFSGPNGSLYRIVRPASRDSR